MYNEHACVRKKGRWERDLERTLNSVGFPSATVQTESTADGDAAVFIHHMQPHLTSAPSLHTVDAKMYMYSNESESFRASQ